MLKVEELSDPQSCLNRALPQERIFVGLARDEAIPHMIREWAKKRIAIGKNKLDDPQILEALACADQMEHERPQIRERLEEMRRG